MADLRFIPLVFWHPNTVLVIHWRCGPVLGTQRGDFCPLLYSLVGILCTSYGIYIYICNSETCSSKNSLNWVLECGNLQCQLSYEIQPTYCFSDWW
jgi:hypothetical protein